MGGGDRGEGSGGEILLQAEDDVWEFSGRGVECERLLKGGREVECVGERGHLWGYC